MESSEGPPDTTKKDRADSFVKELQNLVEEYSDEVSLAVVTVITTKNQTLGIVIDSDGTLVDVLNLPKTALALERMIDHKNLVAASLIEAIAVRDTSKARHISAATSMRDANTNSERQQTQTEP